MTKPIKKPPPSGHVKVHIPANLGPTYSNFALITNSASEIIIDFAQIMPKMPQAHVKSRVVMTPSNAKLVYLALGEHLERFENQYGEIKIREKTSLADQLFRSPFSTDESPDEESNG
jgi:hypothetical protein